MKPLFFVLFLAIFSCCKLSAQSVQVSEEAAITRIMDQYMSESKAEPTIKGYRIQIITTDDRRAMEAARAKFTTMYPDVYLEWEHVVPYYKIKVGAYKEKIDLQVFLQELRSEFPSAIPIMDNVEKRELLN